MCVGKLFHIRGSCFTSGRHFMSGLLFHPFTKARIFVRLSVDPPPPLESVGVKHFQQLQLVPKGASPRRPPPMRRIYVPTRPPANRSSCSPSTSLFSCYCIVLFSVCPAPGLYALLRQGLLVVFMTITAFSLYEAENLVPFAPYGATGVLKGSVLAFFGFLGFDEVTGRRFYVFYCGGFGWLAPSSSLQY